MIQISPGLDEIWGKCVGYPGRKGFLQFVRQNMHKPLAPFYAFQDETVEKIRTKIYIREKIEDLLDLVNRSVLQSDLGMNLVFDNLSKTVKRLAKFPNLWTGIAAFLLGILDFFRHMVFSIALFVVEMWAGIGLSKDFPKVADKCVQPKERCKEIEHIQELDEFDDIFEQNQLTLFLKIKRGCALRLKIAYLLSPFVLNHAWPPGEYYGTHTLHSFSWLMIDNDKHGIYMSNFDGSMENYIGDFIDKRVWALDLVFKYHEDYPVGGVRQVEAFSHWLRERQVVCLLYYSAYQNETVINLIRDRHLVNILQENFDHESIRESLNLL